MCRLQRKRMHFELAKEQSRRRLVLSGELCWLRSLRERRIRTMNRQHWEIFWTQNMLNFTEDQWKRHFRMSRPTFDFITEQLRPTLLKQTTNFRKPSDYRRRLAVIIWWLSIRGFNFLLTKIWTIWGTIPTVAIQRDSLNLGGKSLLIFCMRWVWKILTIWQMISKLSIVYLKLYAGARNRNGKLYSKKSMQALRYGIQRHFLQAPNEIDIAKDPALAKFGGVFRSVVAQLSSEGKANIKQHTPVSVADMRLIQNSFDLESPEGLQQVIINVMAYFANWWDGESSSNDTQWLCLERTRWLSVF